MHTFDQPGERVFVLLSQRQPVAARSRSSRCCAATSTRARAWPGRRRCTTPRGSSASRCGASRTSTAPRWSATSTSSTSTSSSAARSAASRPGLFLIYPQGNPLQATEDSPYLQIGETKYGRPILDRGIRFDRTTLEEAAKYALLSIDSTMNSNVTVGPPIDLLAYGVGRAGGHAPAPLRRRRPGPGEDPHPLGAGAAPGRRRACRRSGSAPAAPPAPRTRLRRRRSSSSSPARGPTRPRTRARRSPSARPLERGAPGARTSARAAAPLSSRAPSR